MVGREHRSILAVTIARHLVGLRGFETDGAADGAPSAADLIEPWLTSLMTGGRGAPRADGSD